MNKNLEKLQNESTWKAVLSNSIPAMIAMIMMLIYNMADLFFVGKTGEEIQVTAVSLATPLFLGFMSIGTIFGVGGTALISRYFGAKETEKVKKVSSFCFWATTVIGVIFSLVIYLNVGSIVKILGASKDAAPLVSSYLKIICISGPFIMISACLSNLVRAEGKAKNAMIGMMMGNIINIILDPIFILVLGLGIKGAAIATVVGNIVGGLYFIIYLFSKKSVISGDIKDFCFDKNIIKNVLLIGIPASLSSILMSVSEIVLNAEMASYGDLAVAGIGVATKVSMMTNMIFIGLGQGVQPLFGYAIGSKDEKRYKDIMKFSSIFAFSLSVIITVFCYVNLGSIVGGFLNDGASFEYAYSFSQMRLPTAILFGVFCVLINALQAAGAVKSSLIVNMSRQGLIFIPSVYILGKMYGEFGLILAQPVADVLSFIMVVVLYFITSKHIFKKEEADFNDEYELAS